MNILVVGNGQHTKRKIIPALKVLKTIKNITVADRNSEIFELNNNCLLYTSDAADDQ